MTLGRNNNYFIIFIIFMADEKSQESYAVAQQKALSKYSFSGAAHLSLTLTEQILVSELLDISQYYPNMKSDPGFKDALRKVENLKH